MIPDTKSKFVKFSNTKKSTSIFLPLLPPLVSEDSKFEIPCKQSLLSFSLYYCLPTFNHFSISLTLSLSKTLSNFKLLFIHSSMETPLDSAEIPPTVEPVIEYIPSEDLTPLLHPDSQIQGLLEGLNSKDWVTICESLNETRRLALYHSELLLPLLEPVMVVLVKAMKNPRSALCKTSIMAAADVFVAYGDKLLEDTLCGGFDNMVLQLLLKASQDKRFVCEEADKTLNSMVQSLTPLPLLQNLQKYAKHFNPKVRAKAAVSISNCVSRMNFADLQEFGLVSLVQVAANLLNDRLPEAREAARSITMSVYKSFIENEEDQKQESWQNFCESNLPALHGQSIIKITTTN